MKNTRCSDGDLDAVKPSPQQDYEQLQLIDTDVLIVKRVQQTGEGGREYVELSTALFEVGVGTLTNLRKNNLLFSILRQRRIVVPGPPESWSKDAPRVIYLSVRGTVPDFMRRQVLDGGWEPAKGTTLKTFFVTACLYGFAREYRIYYREERGGHHLEYCVDDVTMLTDCDQKYGPEPPEDPESIAVDRDTLRNLLPPDTDPDLLTILVRSSQQFTQKEIADELGISEEAVSSRIRRFRQRGGRQHSAQTGWRS
jgi:biotin operon repressor